MSIDLQREPFPGLKEILPQRWCAAPCASTSRPGTARCTSSSSTSTVCTQCVCGPSGEVDRTRLLSAQKRAEKSVSNHSTTADTAAAPSGATPPPIDALSRKSEVKVVSATDMVERSSERTSCGAVTMAWASTGRTSASLSAALRSSCRMVPIDRPWTSSQNGRSAASALPPATRMRATSGSTAPPRFSHRSRATITLSSMHSNSRP
mmetsp:Transcript_5354/g.21069  ORF Transcript_5354/g.21069 Transcript_5354/m.21069 type:complete len:207 (+) Transcript_5354:117-737(+)